MKKGSLCCCGAVGWTQQERPRKPAGMQVVQSATAPGGQHPQDSRRACSCADVGWTRVASALPTCPSRVTHIRSTKSSWQQYLNWNPIRRQGFSDQLLGACKPFYLKNFFFSFCCTVRFAGSVPWPGIEPEPSTVKVLSLNHWNTWNSPNSTFFGLVMACRILVPWPGTQSLLIAVES